MSIYLDTSALAKLVVAEAETDALRAWIAARPGAGRMINSVGAVELQRFAARRSALDTAVQLLARVDQLDLTATTLARAAQLPPPEIRTLDALHIASAAEVADLDALVTYDLRMIAAARAYGMTVVSPGLDS